MKSCILWDHDGVLVDTERWHFEATRRALEPLGIALAQQEYLVHMAAGRSAWTLAEARGVPAQDIARQRAFRDGLYQRYLAEQDIDIPGVLEVLHELAPHYRMAIVTTSKRADFELVHRHRRIVACMDFVLAKGDYARSKPAPDPYLAALARFGVPPAAAIVVEDSERGMQSALAAGIECVVVANAFVAAQDFRAATHRIETLADLPALLRTT